MRISRRLSEEQIKKGRERITNYSEYQEIVKYRIQPKTHTRMFFDTAEQMPQYHKAIIKRLAEMFTGDDLTQRLNDLKFCDLKTAHEVLKGMIK